MKNKPLSHLKITPCIIKGVPFSALPNQQARLLSLNYLMCRLTKVKRPAAGQLTHPDLPCSIYHVAPQIPNFQSFSPTWGHSKPLQRKQSMAWSSASRPMKALPWLAKGTEILQVWQERVDGPHPTQLSLMPLASWASCLGLVPCLPLLCSASLAFPSRGSGWVDQ